MRTRAAAPVACVMGNTDLVRSLVPLGIECVAVAQPGFPIAYSRLVTGVIPWPGSDEKDDEDAAIERLIAFARAQPRRPVLFYETDYFLAVVSEHRDRLRQYFDFVLDETDRLTCSTDKARFSQEAERLDLPVPWSRAVTPTEDTPPVDELPYPVIVKPLSRADGRWASVEPARKAVRIDGPQQWTDLRRRVARADLTVLIQQLIPGPESRIESYHFYADPSGEIVGDFTGQKVRTRPSEYGASTALIITDRDDVRRAGRQTAFALGLRGVAKIDFKRDPEGKLWLLEVNPRFTLWNYPGALAGVNIPGLVYADLTGDERPATSSPRAGIRWWHPLDLLTARAPGQPLGDQLRWCISAEARSVLNGDDPMPFVGHLVWRLRRRLGRARGPATSRADSGGPGIADESRR